MMVGLLVVGEKRPIFTFTQAKGSRIVSEPYLEGFEERRGGRAAARSFWGEPA